MTRYVIYTRADPGAPGAARSSLVMQDRAIAAFLDHHATVPTVLARFCDPGGADAAGQMALALALCQSTAAVLLVARVDRLPLAEMGLAPFFANPELVLRVAALPDVARDALCLYARLQLQERLFHDQPSAPLPAPRPACDIARDNRVLDQIAPVILPLRASGATLRDMASALNRIGMTTRRGTAWRANHIARLLLYLDSPAAGMAQQAPAQTG